MSPLETLFQPQSVAIVGVSTDPKKIGNAIFRNLLSMRYAGKILLVNPKYNSIGVFKCFKSISDITEPIDVACIVTPKDTVKGIVSECVSKGVKNVIIIAAGFGETGEEGKTLEQEIYQIVKNTQTRILGPNCLGYISTFSNTNVSFASSHPSLGNISFLSQSGALCTALLDMANSDKLGFSNFVSIGNKIDIKENDLLKYFLSDQNTSVISAYLESISSGIDMLKIYSSSKTLKPFILFKPGKSNQAQSAMLSHTGSIAGDSKIFQTAMDQYGVITVETIESMYNLMRSFSWGKEIKGNRVAIVTNAGGPGIIATDLIVQYGLNLASISQSSKTKLKEILPQASSINNPVDVLGDANSERYQKALDILIADENVDVILVLLTPQYVTEIDQTTEVIINSSSKTDKSIVPVYMGDKSMGNSKNLFHSKYIPLYRDIKDALEVIFHMYSYSMFVKKSHTNMLSSFESAGQSVYTNEIAQYLTDTPTPLPDLLVENLMKEVSIDLPLQKYCKNVDEAKIFAKDIYPVVIKAPNSLIAHKTDIKALYTNIQNENELVALFETLRSSIQQHTGALPEHILVQKQIKAKEELILGIKRDGNSTVYRNGRGFGHLLLFGKGGIHTEVYNDHAFGLIPMDYETTLRVISNTKVSKIINGNRGESRLAITELVKTIIRLQSLILMYPEIESMDINPLFIDETNVYAVDVKINVAR